VALAVARAAARAQARVGRLRMRVPLGTPEAIDPYRRAARSSSRRVCGACPRMKRPLRDAEGLGWLSRAVFVESRRGLRRARSPNGAIIGRMKLPMDGGCRCDRVRIRVSRAPLVATGACHCLGCQRMSSSAFSLTGIFPADAFAVIAGEPVIGRMHGPEVQHYFCNRSGVGLRQTS